MYIYSVGYNSYEECPYTVLIHEKKFTKKQFNNIIAEGVVEVAKKMKKKKEFLHSFEDIYRQGLIEWLIKNKNFKTLKYHLEWSTFGWGSLFDDKYWENDIDKNIVLFRKKLKEAGFTKEDDSMGKE